MSEQHDHEWHFLSSHAQTGPDGKVATTDTYDYCPRCGTLRHDVSFGPEQHERPGNYPLYTSIPGRINAQPEPPCVDRRRP